jgi:hypothetical protein
VNGLLKIPKPSKPILIHGTILVAALVIIQLLLDAFQNSFLLYMPPIGFAFFIFTQYGIQAIIIGTLNIIIMQRMYKMEDWQTGFWLNGLLLLLIFSTITLVIQTMTGLPFTPYTAIIVILILPYPFGYIGKYSNKTRKKQTTTTNIETI